MTKEAEDLVAFIQVHCLWQFASRTPDREENIKGVLAMTEELLAGGTPQPKTPMERCHFADARQLADQAKVALPWLNGTQKDDLHQVVSDAMARIHEITVEHSLNGELNQPGY